MSGLAEFNRTTPLEAVRDRVEQLVPALVRARQRITSGKVFKAGQNQHQRYAYVGHEDVVAVARHALLAEGLTLTQVSVKYLCNLPTPTSKSADSFAHLWEGSFWLCHESGQGQYMTFQASTQANDKSAFVASTALDRTALMRVLQLAGSAEENPEHDSHDVQERAPEQNHQQAARAMEKRDAGQTAAQYMAEQIADHIKVLGTLDNDGVLVEWGRWLMDYTAPKAFKVPAWDAFGKRCVELGLIAQEVAAKIRGGQ